MLFEFDYVIIAGINRQSDSRINGFTQTDISVIVLFLPEGFEEIVIDINAASKLLLMVILMRRPISPPTLILLVHIGFIMSFAFKEYEIKKIR